MKEQPQRDIALQRDTALDELLATGAADADGRRYRITPDWMQGRTAYGGISAALALDAALATYPGDAPLRSAQLSFVGPVGGDCHVATRMLRESKSSRFVAADLSSEAGYGTNALFSFMSARESEIDHHRIEAPDMPDPQDLVVAPAGPARPTFVSKLEMRPFHGPDFGYGRDDADILAWVRWVDPPACDTHVALLALADALPPAAMPLFPRMGPLSSSTWVQHFVTDRPATEDGWWLLASRSSHIRRGFSVQDMHIWNSARELVSIGGQGVAIYV